VDVHLKLLGDDNTVEVFEDLVNKSIKMIQSKSYYEPYRVVLEQL